MAGGLRACVRRGEGGAPGRRPLQAGGALPGRGDCQGRRVAGLCFKPKPGPGAKVAPRALATQVLGPGGASLARRPSLPGGLVVRIRRSHRRGPGSIPGQGSLASFALPPNLPGAFTPPLLTNRLARFSSALHVQPDPSAHPAFWPRSPASGLQLLPSPLPDARLAPSLPQPQTRLATTAFPLPWPPADTQTTRPHTQTQTRTHAPTTLHTYPVASAPPNGLGLSSNAASAASALPAGTSVPTGWAT